MRLRPGILFPFGCVLVACVPAQARIGETKKECEERYGKPAETRESGSVHLYTKEGLILLVFFHEEKAGYIMYKKAEETSLGAVKFTEDERQVLLKANGGAREWKVLGEDGATTVLETRDGAMRAQYNAVSHTLIIFTPEGVKQRKNSEKSEAEKRLKGF